MGKFKFNFLLRGQVESLSRDKFFSFSSPVLPWLKVNDQLVPYATRFLAVHLKNHVWSHHRALKAKVQCDFASAYSPDHTTV